MSQILELFKQDFPSLILGIFVIMSGVIAIYKIVSEFLSIFWKPIGVAKQRKLDHETIIHNTEVINELSSYMEDVKEEIKQLSDNRIRDREQSRAYQSEYMTSLSKVLETQEQRDNQILALMCGTKELLGAEIDHRYAKYIKLNGIPENEIDEFDSIYDAYRGLNGNHGRETKYKYVKEHLSVIPVRTELVTK